jgi:hypothetical protein
VKTAASQAHLAHQADLARTVVLADQAHQAHQVSLVDHRKKSASLSLLHLADHAHQASLASQDLKDHPATLAHQAHQATQAKMDNQAAQAHKDPLAHLAILAPMDHVVSLAHQLSALQVPQETLAPLAQTDHPAQLVNQDPKATMVLQVHQDPKDHQVQLVRQARMVHLATKAHQVQMDPRESLAFAPNTALWTAVSSSKMAHGAKPAARPNISLLQSWPSGYGECCSLLAIHLFLLIFRSTNATVRKAPTTFFFEFRFITAITRCNR